MCCGDIRSRVQLSARTFALPDATLAVGEDRSKRGNPWGLAGFDDPFHDNDVTVITCGRMCFERQKVKLGQGLCGTGRRK